MLDTPLTDPAVRLEVSDDHMGELLRRRPHPQGSDQPRRRRTPVGQRRTPDRDRAPHRAQTLHWDAAKEKFMGEGAKEANAQLARRMRKPYDYSFAG